MAVGDSTRLEIIFKTGGYSNIVTKSPIIKTNEGLQDKSVRIKANIVVKPDSTYPIVIKPFKLEFAAFRDSMPTELKFTITNVSGRPVVPTLVNSPLDLLRVELPKSVPAGKSVTGVVRLKKVGLKGSFEKSITVQLDDTQKTRFTIPVRISPRDTSTPAGKLPATGH